MTQIWLFFCQFFDLNLILYDTVIRPRSLSCVFLNQIHMGGFSKRLQSVQIMLHFIHPDVHTRAAAAAPQRTIVKLCALSLWVFCPSSLEHNVVGSDAQQHWHPDMCSVHVHIYSMLLCLSPWDWRLIVLHSYYNVDKHNKKSESEMHTANSGSHQAKKKPFLYYNPMLRSLNLSCLKSLFSI